MHMKRQPSNVLISVAAASLVAGAVVGQAQFTLALYEFGTASPGTLASTDEDTQSVATDLSAVAPVGYTVPSIITTAGNPAYSLDVGSDDTPNSWDSGYYLQFTVTPDSGRQLNLTSFSFDSNNYGPGNNTLTTYWSLRSSADSFASDIGGTTSSFSNETWGNQSAVGINNAFATGVDFQGISSAITFRFYFWDNNTLGNYYGRLDNIQLTGTNVPEPASAGLLAGLGLGAFAFLRRRVNR